MDSDRTKQNHEMPTLKFPSGSVTPLMIPRGRYSHQSTQPYGSSSRANLGGRETPIMNFLSPAALNIGYGGATSYGKKPSFLPWSAVEKLEAVDDNVVVMDEVLVASATTGRKSRRSSLGPASGRGGGGGVSPSSSSSIDSQNLYRNRENCNLLNESGNGLANMHPQKRTHGKAEMLTALSPIVTKKSEAHVSESFMAVISDSHRPSQSLAQHARTRTTSGSNHAPPTASLCNKQIPSPITKHQHDTDKTVTLKHETKPVICSKTNTCTSHDWSPIDDGIKVAMPSNTDAPPTREGLGALIQRVLYGFAKKKRLPVFSDICPGCTSSTSDNA